MKVLRVFSAAAFTFVWLIVCSSAGAINLDQNSDLELSGKVESRVSFRTAESKGFTYPDVVKGHVVQQRNLALMELDHVLSKQTDSTPYLKYHITARLLYEGVYDYGPEEFRDLRDANPDEIDDFKHDEDIWEAYADYAKGPWFFRLGRQNLSWGETDVYQLLDRINPLDNTFGGAFEDLDDRRIPIWMARGNYNFGNVGPISSFTVEGFWNPGHIDQEVAPMSPYGTPYAYPATASVLTTTLHEPEETFQNSRMGIRLQGVLADNFNISIAHYQTIMDTPSAIVAFDTGTFIASQELTYETVQVTGASLSFYEPHVDMIFRSEVAWFWDEPVFIPEINAPVLFGDYRTGEIPTKNVLRYMVGFDKNFWLRFLNNKSMFNCYFQYFAEYYQHYDERMKLAVEEYPTGAFIDMKRYEQKLTLTLTTTYQDGTLTPDITVLYDPRGSMMIIPSIQKAFYPWIVKASYYGICGRENVSMGILDDRDQATLQVTLLF